jgi:hypothetical protein
VGSSKVVPIGVLGFARESPNTNHWFRVVDDRPASGGLLILQGWDGVDDQGRHFEFDDWVDSIDGLASFFSRLPWRIDWSGSGRHEAPAEPPTAG